MATITSNNSSFALAVTGLFNTPQLLQGYAADDMFSTEAVDRAEVVMGVDGKLSAGKIFVPVQMTIMLMPTSPSMQMFDRWMSTEDGLGDVLPAQAVIIMPSIGRKFTLSNGVLTKAQRMPAAKKTLQPLSYTITWESVVGEAAL